MIRPLTPTARPKAPQAKATSPVDAEAQAFDLAQAETAELLRERDAMETLMLQQLKNEDAIMKKWIEMI
ncbi:MAG TPA: hypothetical protein VFN49_05650 [Candidatus Aquilonibacter sp.]|nr:hypothetical protein [Candidatus Aquilonibacter sp.]